MLETLVVLLALYKEYVPATVRVSIYALAIIGLVGLFAPEYIPFEFFYFWKMNGNLGDWLLASWPIFAWGGGLTLLAALFFPSRLVGLEKYEDMGAGQAFKHGFKTSLWAGVTEEVAFRWLFFLAAIFFVQFTSWCFFDWIKVIGFFGQYNVRYGYIEVAHHVLAGPVSNFLTLGYLHDWIFYSPFHINGWAVGAALLLANATFRDGHKYGGLIGWINSWFIGMYLFWLMFSYGLLAAIIAHFVYDLCVFWIMATVVYFRER